MLTPRSQVDGVIELSGDTAGTPGGVLTSDNRDNWTDTRAALLAADPANAASLEAIESAMIVVCLDDTKPVTRELIVFDNGRSDFLGEHSCRDGTPTLRMNEFVLATLALGKADLGATPPRRSPRPRSSSSRSTPPRAPSSPAPPCASLAAACWTTRLRQGRDQGLRRVARHVGAARQAARVPQYVRATRGEVRERADASAPSESKAWAEAMLDPGVGDALFRVAVTRHLKYAAWEADGQGMARHLFGLKKMLREGESVPALYLDRAQITGSTSQLRGGGAGWVWAVVCDWGAVYPVDDYEHAGTRRCCGGGAKGGEGREGQGKVVIRFN
ncbi:hypothetical protein B0H11DRAFT_1136967 [Mycena galericulata]|nr:hypothetical protein B0H11DRAFT_1136967 [Mycena galericulata]